MTAFEQAAVALRAFGSAEEHAPLLERAFVEEQFQTLARGELALGVLRSDAFLAAAKAGTLTARFELLDHRVHEGASFLLSSCDAGAVFRGRSEPFEDRGDFLAAADAHGDKP